MKIKKKFWFDRKVLKSNYYHTSPITYFLCREIMASNVVLAEGMEGHLKETTCLNGSTVENKIQNNRKYGNASLCFSNASF